MRFDRSAPRDGEASFGSSRVPQGLRRNTWGIIRK